MSVTGVVKDHPLLQPAGTSPVCSRDGTAACHQGSGRVPLRTSVPGSIRTPDSGSVSASASKTAYDVRAQRGHAVLGQRPVGVPEPGRHRGGRLARQVAGDHVDAVPGLEQPHGAGQADDTGPDHDHPRHACSLADRRAGKVTFRSPSLLT